MSLFLDNLEAEIYRTAKYGGGISALLDQLMESGGRYVEKRENALQIWELVKSSIEGVFLDKYPKE